MRGIVAGFILLSTLAACTGAPQEAVQVPTLAVLPSETPIPTDTPTIAPTETPTLTLTPSATATFTYTPTPLATSTPLPTSTPDCSVGDWWRSIEDTVQQFLDTAEVAAQTARMSLSTVILEMRQLQRDYERTDYPDCARDVYFEIRAGMSSATDGFTSFMGESEVVSSVQLALASQYFWNAGELLRGKVLLNEYRILDTAVLIWGGDSPNAATATWMARTATFTPMPSTCFAQDLRELIAFGNSAMPLIDGLTNVQDAARLGEIRDAIEALPYPRCFETARRHLLNAFDEMYLALISSTPTTVAEHVDNAVASMELFREETERLGFNNP